MKHIKITINRLGIPLLDGLGMRGEECNVKMKPFEDAYGGRQSREDKPEMHEIAPEQQEHKDTSL